MPNGHPKPLALVSHHMTKEEREFREKEEAESKSGIEMKPTARVKSNRAALKEFKRIKKLYATIGQDDDMYSNMISDYCIAISQRETYYKMLEEIKKSMGELEEKIKNGSIDFITFIDQKGSLTEQYFKCDDRIQRLTKCVFDHERASLLGLADKMRTIPKKQEEKTAPSRMAERLKRRSEQGVI